MSYLSFGEIGLSRHFDHSSLQGLSWRLLKHAADQNICVFFGCNIPQQVVFEMLGVEKSSIPTSALPFLATASPLEDTSDGLLGPDTLVVSGSGTDTEQIERTLQRLHAWFDAAFGESAVQTIVLCITEGFDTDFTPVFVNVSDFQLKAATVFRENENWWPSMKFVIRRELAG